MHSSRSLARPNADYKGRFLEGFRSPWDINSHPDYEHRFPWGDSTGYWWWDPAFFFNDYHLYDETDYS